eukprot:g7560.t1
MGAWWTPLFEAASGQEVLPNMLQAKRQKAETTKVASTRDSRQTREARREAKKDWAAAREVYGWGHLKTQLAALHLAELEEPKKARWLLQEALPGLEASLGLHKSTLKALRLLALLQPELIWLQKWKRSCEALLGPSHIDTIEMLDANLFRMNTAAAAAHQFLAEILLLQHAESALEAHSRRDRGSLPTEDLSLLLEAEQLFRGARDGSLDARLPRSTFGLTQTLLQLALFDRFDQRVAEAEALLREELKHQDLWTPDFFACQASLAFCLQLQGRDEEAQDLYGKVLPEYCRWADTRPKNWKVSALSLGASVVGAVSAAYNSACLDGDVTKLRWALEASQPDRRERLYRPAPAALPARRWLRRREAKTPRGISVGNERCQAWRRRGQLLGALAAASIGPVPMAAFRRLQLQRCVLLHISQVQRFPLPLDWSCCDLEGSSSRGREMTLAWLLFNCIRLIEDSKISAEKRAELYLRPKIDLATAKSRAEPIIAEVRQDGDAALARLAKRFDKAELSQDDLVIDVASAPWPKVEPKVAKSLDAAYENVRRFHAAQKKPTLCVETMPGVECRRIAVPIEAVGLYVPGGTAVLPSTAYMLAAPAKLAGCKEIVLATPPRADGSICPEVIYAAKRAGATKILKAGGAQAIAAMAFGTKSCPKVHKITGPGNQYVTAAKMMLQADDEAAVSIDMPAGPSEQLCIFDVTSDPSFVVADLLSQAEHGPDSQVVGVFVSPSGETQSYLSRLREEFEQQTSKLSRRDITKQALSKSFVIVVNSLDAAMSFSNGYGPEHLVVQTADPEAYLEKVVNAGSVFMGAFAPESCGDYASGTNHCLPTSGYARQFGGVSTDTLWRYLKYVTVQKLTPAGLKRVGPHVEVIADVEELEAHRNAVTIRLAKIGRELSWLDKLAALCRFC